MNLWLDIFINKISTLYLFPVQFRVLTSPLFLLENEEWAAAWFFLFVLHWSITPDQPWDFFGRNDAKAETPVLWPPHEKSWLIGKDSDTGRDWGQEEKGTTEDEMAGWHHWLEWTLGVGDGQGGLLCCDSWGRKESDATERLNWTDGHSVHFFEELQNCFPRSDTPFNTFTSSVCSF